MFIYQIYNIYINVILLMISKHKNPAKCEIGNASNWRARIDVIDPSLTCRFVETSKDYMQSDLLQLAVNLKKIGQDFVLMNWHKSINISKITYFGKTNFWGYPVYCSISWRTNTSSPPYFWFLFIFCLYAYFRLG